MADEMPPELLEAMQDLDGKHWDDIIDMWRKGEAEKKRYAEQYYKQVGNLNQGNRTFQERNRMLTPAERNAEIDQNHLREVQTRKEIDLEKQPKELTTEERQEKFAELKNSLFKYTKLEEPSDPPQGKGKIEPDKDDPNDPDKDV